MGTLGVGSPELLVQRAAALKKMRPDSPDVTRAAKRLELAKKTLLKIREKKMRRPHYKEIWIYVFPEKELRGLSHNFHIHVSVRDLYIPMSCPPISAAECADRLWEHIIRTQKPECRN